MSDKRAVAVLSSDEGVKGVVWFSQVSYSIFFS